MSARTKTLQSDSPANNLEAGQPEQPHGGVQPEQKGASLQRSGTLERAGTNLTMMRAGTLSVDDAQLPIAVQNTQIFDQEADRPFWGGLWKLQQFIGFCLGVLFLLVVWIAEPVPTQYSKANEMLGITMLCGIFWVFEVVPIYITALLPLCLMPLFSITSSAIAAQSYWNPIQMLVVGTYLVDIALEQVSLPRRAALLALLGSRVTQPGLVLFAFMLMSFTLSIFCNNIAVTLMITPFAVGLLNAASDRVLDAGADLQLQSSERTESEDHVDVRSRQVDSFSRGIMVGLAYGATTGGMASLIGSIPNELLLGSGHISSLIGFGDFMRFAFPVSVVTFLVCFASIYFRYVSHLRGAIITSDLLQAEYEALVEEIGPFGRDELAVGLVQALQFGLLLFKPLLAKLIVTPFGAELLSDATLACLPACLLFFIPSKRNPGCAVLTWPAVHEKFDFGLLLLIGGGFAIASGFSQSGLNVALGDGMGHLMRNSSDLLVTFVVMFVCAIATQVFSAIGTATTVLPALQAAAVNSVRNPLGLMLPATIACSMAFTLPTATPANVVVLAKSSSVHAQLRVRDFLFSGLPVNLIMSVLAVFLVYATGRSVFDAFAPFPEWACDGVTCIWGNVSGTMQACICEVDTNMTRCQLADGTIMSVSKFLVPGM